MTENYQDVDEYGLPLAAFGRQPPKEFFAIIGRLVAVLGKIEYLADRLAHLPASETVSIRKVEQFAARREEGRAARNSLVHSYWVYGAHAEDESAFIAIRYKTRRQTSGSLATVALVGEPETAREQDFTVYSVDELRALLRSSVATMHVGEMAYTEVSRRALFGP